MNYFQHPYCSNSALSKLKESFLDGRDPYEAYRLGSLFDAVVTEHQLLDLINMEIIGTDYSFTKDEYEDCKKMKKALLRHPKYSQIMQISCVEYQKEVYLDTVPFSFNGIDFELSVKGKLDLFLPGLVIDIKSTFAVSFSAFIQACDLFDYWRQMVLYCKLNGAKKAYIFGVSKKNHKVFFVEMEEGDANWIKGEESLNELAFKYYLST